MDVRNAPDDERRRIERTLSVVVELLGDRGMGEDRLCAVASRWMMRD